ALEGADVVELHRGAEALGLGLHADERGEVLLERLLTRGEARRAGRLDLLAEHLLGDRDLEELLLVHLQRAVAAAEAHAPGAVAHELDLVVARLLDVELDEDVLVVADARGLDLVEDLADERLGELGLAQDALTLAAAAADGLEAHAAAGIVGEHLRDLALDLLAELVD